MSITLTYQDTVSRVRIEASGLAADEVRVERSTNELHWQTVRGGVEVEVSAGAIGPVDDYEFPAGVENFYRIVDTSDGTVEESDSVVPVLGSIWLKSIRWPFLNRPVTVVDFSDIGRRSRTGVSEVKGRSVPIAVHDRRASPDFTLEVMTATAEAARDMDLVVAAGGTFFVHMPADCPVPGGYVEIGDTGEQRRTRSGRSPRRYFQLPCRVVAAPGPDIVGGTMTYGALLNLYGGYNNVLAANSAYADVLDLMADPEDLVVL